MTVKRKKRESLREAIRRLKVCRCGTTFGQGSIGIVPKDNKVKFIIPACGTCATIRGVLEDFLKEPSVKIVYLNQAA